MDLNGKRVAIVMMSAIGDAVHVLPVVNSLRATAPNVHLSWVIQPAPAELVRHHPGVDEFVIFDRKRGWRAFQDVLAATRGHEYDLVLALQVYLKAGLITGMLRSPRKLGFDRVRARDANWLFTTERITAQGQRHVQDQYLEFLEHLGVPVVLSWAGLEPTEAEEARYGSLLPGHEGPTVAMVLGTSKPAKEWPADRYAELAVRLRAALGARTLLVGGRSPREMEAAGRILERAEGAAHVMLEWDLRKLVYLLSRSDVLVSPDTGPLHIGVALGTPTVGLFGYTNPKRVGPYRRFGELLIDAYGDAGEVYPISPACREGRMGRISVDEVLDRVQLALRVYPRERASGQSGP